MTMLRCDSFDFYNTSQLGRFWTISNGAPTIASGGRNGTNCLSITNLNQKISWTFPSNLSEGFEHFALSFPSAGAASEAVFYRVVDNATTQLTFFVRADRKIEVRMGTSAGTLIGTTSQSLPSPGILTHLQIHWVIHNSAGSVRILMDDTEVMNETGKDTQNSANAYATLGLFGTESFLNSAMSNFLIDDFVFCDNAGSVNNTLLGDKRVKWCPALNEGAQNDYTPSTGTDNAALVDENPANDDTDYIESSTVGHIDYVTISVSPAIPSGSTIDAVAVVTTDKKTDGGTRTAKHKIRFGSGPTVSNGAAFGPVTTYAIHKTIFEDAITVSEVNAPMQVGVEVVT